MAKHGEVGGNHPSWLQEIPHHDLLSLSIKSQSLTLKSLQQHLVKFHVTILDKYVPKSKFSNAHVKPRVQSPVPHRSQSTTFSKFYFKKWTITTLVLLDFWFVGHEPSLTINIATIMSNTGSLTIFTTISLTQIPYGMSSLKVLWKITSRLEIGSLAIPKGHVERVLEDVLGAEKKVRTCSFNLKSFLSTSRPFKTDPRKCITSSYCKRF